MKRQVLMVLIASLFLGVCMAQQQGGKKKRQGPKGGRKSWFQRADANGDGIIDDTEAEQVAANQLKWMQKRGQALVQQYDANGDKKLDEAELAKARDELEKKGQGKMLDRQLKQFKQLDTDGDWEISPDEEAQATKAIVARTKKLKKQGAKAGANPRQRGNKGAQGGGPRQAQRLWVNPDTNGDCIIDDTEIRNAAERAVELVRKMLAAQKKRTPGQTMKGIDPNENWELDPDEATTIAEKVVGIYQNQNEAVLKFFDRDEDGVLSESELASAKRAMLFSKELKRTQTQLQMAMRGMNPRAGQRGGKRRQGQGGK